jgi:hypothetical protein
LLRGERADLVEGVDPLADLLGAAAAPAVTEFAGERAAVAAFRNARLTSAPQPRSDSMIKTTLAKVLTVKAAAIAITATALGGVAVAAGTGAIPTGGSNSHPASAHATSVPTTRPTHPTHPTEAQGSPSSHPATAPSSSPSPSPSLRGLCHAYTAGVADNPGKALENPAFSALIAAGGGKNHVGAYCASLLATVPGHSPAAPTTGHTPGVHPTGKPTSHPTGAPVTHPTGKPTAHGTAAGTPAR